MMTNPNDSLKPEARGAPAVADTSGPSLGRLGLIVVLGGVATGAFVAVNSVIVGIPGALLFAFFDKLPAAILGLPHIHEEYYMGYGVPMGTAWPVGVFVLFVLFVSHKVAAAWSNGKVLLFLAAVAAWSCGLAVHFHRDIISINRVAAQRPELWTPARDGDLEAVKKQIASGARIDKPCSDSVLVAAIQSGRPRVVEALLQGGAQIDFRDCPDQKSPLCTAVEAGDLEVVRVLQQGGSLVNDFDWHGRTPLMCAAEVGNLEAIKFLLENGADIHAVGGGRSTTRPLRINTALISAAMKGRSRATQLLLERGARVNDKGVAGFTALTFAAQGFVIRPGPSAEDFPGTIRILLQHGADPSIKSDQGKTALDYARVGKVPEIIEALEAGPPTK